MRKAIVAAALVAALPLTAASAGHQGCLVYGEGVGLDNVRWCTYTAASEAQAVHVGTPNRWRIWVERTNALGEIVDVTLVEGHGTPAGPPPTVQTTVGDVIHVELHADCDIVGCGTFGVLEAGMADGH